MLGSFLLPFRHLTLDHSRIDSVSPHLSSVRSVAAPTITLIPLLERFRSRAVTFRQPALEDLEAPQEGQPIRVQPDRRRGLDINARVTK